MKLDTAIKLRVAFAFLVLLVILAVYVPSYGLPLALIWAAIVLWQYKKQNPQ